MENMDLVVTDNQPPAVVITDTQIDLIKRTLAKDATAEELQLFFYDNRRRGVHPLDKLIHFTKRGGKYTPITSIDFMRSRAAETGDYAGNDDAVFTGAPKAGEFSAAVTVYRFVRGERCAFSATARWSEYCPPSGQDHMWQKMPHTMLGKCAEALALRKAFPQQTAGLYAAEEMDQAGADRPLRQTAGQDAASEIRQPQRASGRDAGQQTGVISDPQRKRLYAIGKGAGHADEDVRGWLKNLYGVEHSKDILRSDYEAICTRLQDGTPLTSDLEPPEDLDLEPGAVG